MGKKGFSENDGKNNRLIISNHLREKDPSCMLEHELGHVKAFKNKDKNWENENPIFPKLKQDYPNVLNEYPSFFNQFKALIKKYGKNKEEIVKMFLYDYEESNKVSEKDLKNYKIFFEKLYDLFITKI